MAVLEVIKGANAGQRYPLKRDRLVLGRHPDCDIMLDLGAVSRQHAQITRVGNEFFVEDLRSRNGTFVNGHPVSVPERLNDGDELRICDVAMVFRQPRTGAGRAAGGLDDTALGAVLVDDDRLGQSTVLSTLMVAGRGEDLRPAVNPEAKLRALIQITQNLSHSLSVDEVLPKVLDSLFQIFTQADRGFVLLRTGPEGRPVLKAVKHRAPPTNEETVRLSRTIVNQVLTSKQAILSADAASDSRFEMSQSIADFRIRSMMCAPLVNTSGDVLGLIQIDSVDQRGGFQQDDLDMLAGVATQAALAIDNARLHERAMAQQAMQRDLELAHKVQHGLLPAGPPQVAGYRFFDHYEAANQVGGDFFDYIRLPNGRLPNGRLAVVLADVSGKGVSAALVMAKLSADVRYCLASEPTAALAVRRINQSFCQAGWEDRFVTLVLALLDPQSHELTVVNAGHMPPLLRHAAGKVIEMDADCAGLPLGVDADYPYRESIRGILPGQIAVLFTDGISEAMNAERQLYGLQRLRAQVAGQIGAAPDLGRAILEDVQRFVAGQSQSDDMCLVCFGREN